MAGVTLDDGGWGTIASNFANAIAPDPSKRAHMMLYGAQYQKLLLEQEEQRRRMEAIKKSVENYPSTVPPDLRMPIGSDNIEQVGPVLPELQQKYQVNRQQQILDNAAASYLAKSTDDIAKLYGIRSLGAIQTGIPADPGRADVLQTNLQTVGTTLPGYTKEPHTFQPLDASGEATGPAITSTRVPAGPSKLVAPGKPGPTNPFENDASMDQRLLALSTKAQTNPNALTGPELQEAAVHLQNRYGVKNVQSQGPDGSTVTRLVREREPPENFGPLMARLAEYNAWNAQRDDAIRTGRPMPAPLAPYGAPAATTPAVPPVSPDVAGGGGLTGRPGAVAAPAPVAPGPAAPAPIVAPPAPADAPATVGGLPAGKNIGDPTRIGVGDASPIRKEFNDQPAVKKYEQAVLPWQQFKENIKVGTLSSDISLIYNLAKMLDPDSAVRDGEMLIWKRNGGPADYLEGIYNKLVAGGAAMTPALRAQMADTAERAMLANHHGLERQINRYTDIATEYGIKPGLIVPKLPAFEKLNRTEISTITPAGPSGEPEKQKLRPDRSGGAAAPPRPPGRTVRVNPTTGAIEEVP